MSDSTLVGHGRLSKFSRRQFEAAGLEDIAVRVSQGELLARRDTERLSEASLPLLAKLVVLRPDYEPCVTPSVDPVFYLPHSDLAKMVDTIRVAVGELAELIDGDTRVRDFGDCVRTLHVLVDSQEEAEHRSFETWTKQLARDAEHSAIRVSLTGHVPAMKPISAAQAARAMRQVAIAYLQSPAGTEVHAAVGKIGIKTAHVALTYGANHLGQVAVDPESASALQVPEFAELADALRYDTPTPV